VFEHPGVGEPTQSEATPHSDARKQWGGGDGASLVAMLQEKTLQTATYAVQRGTTQSMSLCTLEPLIAVPLTFS
jgi:hypothetical protein